MHQLDSMKISEVFRHNNVSTVDVMSKRTKEARVQDASSAMVNGYDGINKAFTDTTLLDLHQRLGHLAYGTVEHMADSANGPSSPKLSDLRTGQG